MTTAELLDRVLAFDAGPIPTLNGWVFDDDDGVEVGGVHIPVAWRITIERRGSSDQAGWSIRSGRDCLARDTGEWEFETLPTGVSEKYKNRTRFPTYQEAFDFLAEWKPRARAAALELPGHRRWKDREKVWAEEQAEEQAENAGAVKH